MYVYLIWLFIFQCKLIVFFGGVWSSNSEPYIYALSLPTELNSRRHKLIVLIRGIPKKKSIDYGLCKKIKINARSNLYMDLYLGGMIS